MRARAGSKIAGLVPICCRLAVCSLSFAAICAGQPAAIDVEAAPDSRGPPQWPTDQGQLATTFEERFRQFERALADLHDQLHLLASDVQENADHPSAPVRRREPGFRAIYTMDRDGTHASYLIAAPGMITNADPQQ